jgi:hypothetical protein
VFTFVGTSLVDISNGGRLDYVANDEFLDSFVLGHTSTTVGAVDVDNVSTAVLGTSTISSLLGLLEVAYGK